MVQLVFAYAIALYAGLLALFYLAMLVDGPGPASEPPLAGFALVLPVMPAALFLSAPVGIPLLTALHHYRFRRWRTYAGAGGLCAFLTAFVLPLILFGSDATRDPGTLIYPLTVFPVTGVVAGSVYWILVIAGAPGDEDRKADA